MELGWKKEKNASSATWLGLESQHHKSSRLKASVALLFRCEWEMHTVWGNCSRRLWWTQQGGWRFEMFDRTRSGVADKNRRRRTWSWCFLVEQALREHETKRRMLSFVFAQRRPHSLFVRAWPRVRVGAMRSVCRCGTKMRKKNLLSKQSPDQSPPLGLDSRKSGARLCVDWLWAQRSVPAFPSQQEVNAGRRHGIEDVSCSGDDQLCVKRRKEENK